MSEYYGQYTLDKIIESYFPKDYIGNCIEVGAVDGIYLSNTYHFELDGWNCLCIEPQPIYTEDLFRNRKHVLAVAAASSNEEEVEFTTVLANGSNGNWGSSLVPDQRLLREYSALDPDIGYIKVPTRRIDWCIENYFPYETIDFISIDVEGTELDVLHSFDINKYNTTLFIIENNYQDESIREYMYEKNWKLDMVYSVNDLFVKNNG
jgi:FkbM family methyltransferase